MCLYDEENDDFYNEIMESIDEEEIEKEDNIDIQQNTVQNMDLLTMLSDEISERIECDRKKFKFKYNNIRYEAVPLKIFKNKCIFNILKPANEKGTKMIAINEIIYE